MPHSSFIHIDASGKPVGAKGRKRQLTHEIKIDGGTIVMGSAHIGAHPGEKPSHIVPLQDYCMAEAEVTQAVTGSNPSRFKGGSLPVEQVSWNVAHEFIEKLSRPAAGKSPRPLRPQVAASFRVYRCGCRAAVRRSCHPECRFYLLVFRLALWQPGRAVPQAFLYLCF